MGWKTLDDMNFAGKTALVRVDLNVPVRDGRVSDTARIEGILPTVQHITSAGGRVVLLAHFGRPKGQPVAEMSLRVVLPALEAALGAEVTFAEDCIGAPAKRAVGAMEPGTVVLLENTRFHAGEEANDAGLAAAMAALADIYVNDAFSAAHRAHASTEGVARLLPSCAGRLMEAELKALEAALGNPERPVAAIVGGAKVSTKIALLENLVGKVDHLVIGGGMANTFLAAQGHPVGRSLCEHDMADTARAILAAAREAGCSVHLPVDIVVAEALESGVPTRTLPADACPDDAMILDVGPETTSRLAEIFETCNTLIWNGPLGAFEVSPFDTGTCVVARKVAELTEAGRLVSVGGGGDTVAALRAAGVADRMSYLSGAGGAFLEWMEGRSLPGVAILDRP
ncbi:MAG: phosphoglycerate kinase [Alkalilacustris sp.]